MKNILGKLGFDTEAKDSWKILGFGPLRGPDPTEQDITSRSRSARILLALGEDAAWTADDRSKAKSAKEKVIEATAQCEENLQEVRKVRRQLRPDRLPR